MVLKFLSGFTIFLGSLLPWMSYGQVGPKLVLSDHSLNAVDLDQQLLNTIVRQNWSNEDWSEAFRIYTWHAHQNQIRQSLAGDYHVEGTVVYFTPLFPFAPGETYYAEFDYRRIRKKSGAFPVGEHSYDSGKNIDLVFSIPNETVPRTFIEAVYPAGDTLPANLLRMYVQFSAAMSAGESYQHIHLIDEDGNRVEKPFLIVDQELWDSERRRFTLLFDPGRIKRGIQSNLDLGLSLQHNHEYRLVVDSTWRDEHGNALSDNYEKRIVVTAPAREKLSTANWKIIEPDAGSRNPLIVRFDRPLDHALALKYIVILDTFGNTAEGKPSMDLYDKVWTFRPDKPWTMGRYTIQISPLLEDPAGNNFNNPFDVDVSVSQRVISEEPIAIPFFVKQELN